MKIIQASKVGNQDWNYFQENDFENPLVLVLLIDLLEKRRIKNIREEFPCTSFLGQQPGNL
jgi:hypothetical protein